MPRGDVPNEAMCRGELTAVWFKLKNCSLRLGSWSLVSLALRMGAHHGRANIV